MKNLCFRVITMAVGLYFTGAMTNPSRKNSIFFNAVCQWDGYLLTNCSFTGKHDIPGDISQRAATVDVRSNFFWVLLQFPTEKGQNIKHLDLSNNLLPTITLSSLAHLHAWERANHSHSAVHSTSLDLPRPKSVWVKCHRSSWRNGLPYLKVLILRRNKLSDIPKGLWQLKSLQSLDLSFNGISQIGVADFHKCLQLENLYLRRNKIFRIHPEAFKDLKKLQVVDLSGNALTTVLPMMIIALELPRLDADLAGNQWQCDESVAVFQNFISQSWRRKWDEICNKSIGSQEARWQPPRSRVSRDTQLPHSNLNHMKSLIRSKAVGPQEGTHGRFSTLGKKDHAGSDTREQRRRPPRWVRSTQDAQTAGGKEGASQDLVLAVCLAVFITFFVAFCLGAFTRPYVDRLWQQRCRKKKPSSDLAYYNEGYNEMEAARNFQHPRVGLHQACHGLNLCENQGPLSGMEASPQAAVIADRSLGMSKKDPGNRQSRERGRDYTGAGHRKDTMLPNGSTACSIIRSPPNADSNTLISAEQDHICRNGILREINCETEAREDSLGQYSLGVPVIAGRLRTGSGSIHKGSNELDPPLSRGMTAALSKAHTHTKAQRTGEKGERESTEQLPSKFSKEMQASTSFSLPNTQAQQLKGDDAEEEHFTYYCSATPSDPAETDASLPVSPPRWGNDPRVTPANEEPVQIHAPWDTQPELDINYDSDSDEGSLFTLSSTSSEDARNVTEEEAGDEESHRASKPPEDEASGAREDNVTPFEGLEDNITFQESQEKCENQEDLSEKPVISGSDSDLYKSRLDSNKFENPLTLPRSLGNSPSRDKIPDTFSYDYVSAPHSEAVEWHCSLTDLEFSNVDTLPQTPPDSVGVPSGPDKTACHESDSDNCTYEPFIQGTDTGPNNIPIQIPSGEDVKPSQQDSEEGNTHSNPPDTDTKEDHDSREVISQTQLLPFCGDEPALQYERGGGE